MNPYKIFDALYDFQEIAVQYLHCTLRTGVQVPKHQTYMALRHSGHRLLKMIISYYIEMTLSIKAVTTRGCCRFYGRCVTALSTHIISRRAANTGTRDHHVRSVCQLSCDVLLSARHCDTVYRGRQG